jgi:hypothetical protein
LRRWAREVSPKREGSRAFWWFVVDMVLSEFRRGKVEFNIFLNGEFAVRSEVEDGGKAAASRRSPKSGVARGGIVFVVLGVVWITPWAR